MTNLSEIDDKRLVLQLQNGDVRAFDRLFLKYSEKLFCFSFSLLKNSEDAKEIVQEAFFRIWERRAGIDSSKLFKSYLFTISYNLVIDQLRVRLKDREYRSYLERYFETTHADLKNEVDFEKLQEDITAAVEELPEKRKNIYKLSRHEGFSNREIAGKMNITEKTVENQMTLALKHIKSRLGKDILPVLLFLSLMG